MYGSGLECSLVLPDRAGKLASSSQVLWQGQRQELASQESSPVMSCMRHLQHNVWNDCCNNMLQRHAARGCCSVLLCGECIATALVHSGLCASLHAGSDGLLDSSSLPSRCNSACRFSISNLCVATGGFPIPAWFASATCCNILQPVRQCAFWWSLQQRRSGLSDMQSLCTAR